MNELADSVVVVGQRVRCGFHWAGSGVIVAIHGEQSPGTVRSLAGGVCVTGGNASFDVAFKNGHFSRGVPEAIVRGVQWEILEDVATTDEVIEAVQFCKLAEAKARETAEAHKARREEERKQYAAENANLLKKSDRPDWSPGRLAAENIRRELKQHYKGYKFAIRSDYNSVRINWVDGPTTKAIEEIADRYKRGNFDGMTDSYEVNEDATFAQVFGDPQYVFCSREYADGLQEKVGRMLCQRQRVEYRGNNTRHVYGLNDDRYLSDHVYQLLQNATFQPGETVVGITNEERDGIWSPYRLVAGVPIERPIPETLCREFVERLKTTAEQCRKSPEFVYGLWYRYTKEAADQSKIWSEFLEWYGAQLFEQR